MLQQTRFGGAYGDLTNIGTILGISTPSPSFPSSSVPDYPCYASSPPAAGDDSSHNMFLCTAKGTQSWTALQSILASHPGAIVLLGNEPNLTDQDNMTPYDMAVWYHGIINGPLSGYTYQAALPAIAQTNPISYVPYTPSTNNPYEASYPSMECYLAEFFIQYQNTYGSYPPYEYAAYHTYGGPCSTDPATDALNIANLLDDWYKFWGRMGLPIPKSIVTECGSNTGYRSQSNAYMQGFTAAMVQIFEGYHGTRVNLQAWCAFLVGYDSYWGSLNLFTDPTMSSLSAYGQEYQYEGELDMQLLGPGQANQISHSVGPGDTFIPIPSGVGIPSTATMAIVDYSAAFPNMGDALAFLNTLSYGGSADLTSSFHPQVSGEYEGRSAIVPILVSNGVQGFTVHVWGSDTVTLYVNLYGYA